MSLMGLKLVVQFRHRANEEFSFGCFVHDLILPGCATRWVLRRCQLIHLILLRTSSFRLFHILKQFKKTPAVYGHATSLAKLLWPNALFNDLCSSSTHNIFIKHLLCPGQWHGNWERAGELAKALPLPLPPPAVSISVGRYQMIQTN